MLVRAALKDRAHEIGLPDSLRALIEHSDETLARQINYILEQLESPPPDEKEVRDVMSFACVGWADPMPRDLIISVINIIVVITIIVIIIIVIIITTTTTIRRATTRLRRSRRRTTTPTTTPTSPTMTRCAITHSIAS